MTRPFSRIPAPLLAALGGALGVWAVIVVVTGVSCSNQLTVEEADAAVTASCVLLSRAMTRQRPERLDAVLAQVCQPGRTREFIGRVIAHDPEISPRDFLDLGFDVPPESPPSSLPTDAGIPRTRGTP